MMRWGVQEGSRGRVGLVATLLLVACLTGCGSSPSTSNAAIQSTATATQNMMDQLVGVWQQTLKDGQTVPGNTQILQFTRDGTITLQSPAGTRTGTYTVDGTSHLTVDVDGSKTIATVTLDSATLTLAVNGSIAVYHKTA